MLVDTEHSRSLSFLPASAVFTFCTVDGRDMAAEVPCRVAKKAKLEHVLQHDPAVQCTWVKTSPHGARMPIVCLKLRQTPDSPYCEYHGRLDKLVPCPYEPGHLITPDNLTAHTRQCRDKLGGVSVEEHLANKAAEQASVHARREAKVAHKKARPDMGYLDLPKPHVACLQLLRSSPDIPSPQYAVHPCNVAGTGRCAQTLDSEIAAALSAALVIPWDSLPLHVNPTSYLPVDRSCKKQNQLENIVAAIRDLMSHMQANSHPLTLVDFCSGSGHTGLLLATLFPQHRYLGLSVCILVLDGSCFFYRAESMRVCVCKVHYVFEWLFHFVYVCVSVSVYLYLRLCMCVSLGMYVRLCLRLCGSTAGWCVWNGMHTPWLLAERA